MSKIRYYAVYECSNTYLELCLETSSKVLFQHVEVPTFQSLTFVVTVASAIRISAPRLIIFTVSRLSSNYEKHCIGYFVFYIFPASTFLLIMLPIYVNTFTRRIISYQNLHFILIYLKLT